MLFQGAHAGRASAMGQSGLNNKIYQTTSSRRKCTYNFSVDRSNVRHVA